MTGASRARPGDRPCIPYVGRTNPGGGGGGGGGHICEVQLLLRSAYELKIGSCHDNFVKARNMLA